jgi:hypothetical protein
MFRVVTRDDHAVLVRTGSNPGTQNIALLRAAGPVEIAYLHLVATLLRKVIPQTTPCVVGVVHKIPTGYTFECRGVWDKKDEAQHHYDAMPIPPDAHGKMMVCFDGSTLWQPA